MTKTLAYLRLTRPANIITAISDILLGFAISGAAVQLVEQAGAWYASPQAYALAWLILSTIGLYGGGIVFNDVCDAPLDKVERPERPIPSEQASIAGATLLASLLFVVGILAARQVSIISTLIACAITALAIFYDVVGKHRPIFGPLNMGLCRGGNLLLGISAVTSALAEYWYLAVIPVLYITAVTLLSRGEVHGGNAHVLRLTAALYLAVFLIIAGTAFFVMPSPQWQVLPFLLLFASISYPPLIKAIRNQDAKSIGLAVKAGIIALIVMNATVSVAFAGWIYGMFILLLLPLSMVLANIFAVT